MIVRRLRLVNILSHENTEVKFPDGVLSIVGPNGAGKSSLIDSIYLALFNEAVPNIRGGKKEFIVMRGKERGEISVEFEVGGRSYLVVRRINLFGPSEAFLYELEHGTRKLVAEGVSNVVREVGKILGLLTYSTGDELRKLVRATILALQDELTEIIDIRDSERKEWILSLLGLSYLEKALEELKNHTRELRKELEKERSEKLGRLNVLRRRVDENRTKIKELEEELKKYEGMLVEAERRMREYENKLSILNSAIDLCYQLRNGLVLRKISELEERVRSLEPVESWDPEVYAHYERGLRDRSKELERVEKELEKILEELSRRLGTQLSGPEDVSRLYRELGGRIQELREKVGGYRGLRDLYRQMLSKLELGELCPVCGSRISNPEEVRRRLSNTLSEIERALSSCDDELRELEDRYYLLEKMNQRLSELIASKENLMKDLRASGEELDRLSSRARELCDKINVKFSVIDECLGALRSMRDELRNVKAELNIYRRMFTGSAPLPSESVEVLKDRLAKVLSQLGISSPVKFTPESIDRLINEELNPAKRRLEQELEVARDKFSELSVERAKKLELLNDRKREVEELGKEISLLENEVRGLEKKIAVVDLIESFGEKYLGKDGQVARGLTRVVRSELERRANRILSRLGLPHIKIGEGFEISIVLPTGELPVRNASGGERVGISIALRLALAEIVMGRTPTTLILDEPTIYLDENRKSQVFNIIKELGKSLKQVIVVTHDETVVNISEKVITIENVGGISRVSESSGPPTQL